MRQRPNASTVLDKAQIDYPSSLTGDEKKILTSDGSWKRIFYLCLAFRILNSLLVQTYFNPDEHWQLLEVAHQLVFGYGHLTWEWKRGIRSYLHPFLFTFLYKVLAILHLDTPWFMMRAPRLFQSIFAAAGDLFLYKFSDVVFGNHVARWTLFSNFTNWFVFFCLTRTLANSLETVLTIVSLYYWPCMRVRSGKASPSSRKLALAIAAFACAVRPTSAVIWLYVGLIELFVASDRFKFVFLESCRACICICIGSYDVWLLGHCSSELPKIQLPFLWWRLLRNSPMALVLHSGFSSDDFHFLAILCGRSDLL